MLAKLWANRDSLMVALALCSGLFYMDHQSDMLADMAAQDAEWIRMDQEDTAMLASLISEVRIELANIIGYRDGASSCPVK